MKLVDKMCKFEMHPASIMEDADRRTDWQTKFNQYTPLNFIGGGYEKHWRAHLPVKSTKETYRKTSSISRTKSQNLNVSCLLL